jgi:hypothetical protein
MIRHLALLALAPSFTKGILVVISAFVLFVGSPYLLASAVLGLRMGYLVVATSLFAWMIIFASIWTFGLYSQGPATPKYLGPRGTEPHWQVIAAGTGSQATRYPETASYPSRPWWTPAANSDAASAIPTVSTAFQVYLSGRAADGVVEVTGPLAPANFIIQNVEFATAEDGTHLAAATGFYASGGPEITLFAYHDKGNVPVYAWSFFLSSIVLFVLHVPFLDRAEKSRKEILTGGTAPAWYGPA